MLIGLFEELNSVKNKAVLLDMENVQFIAVNLLAILGCILDLLAKTKRHTITFVNIHPKVKNVMQRNGFRKYFHWEEIEDEIFKVATLNLE